MEYNDKPDYDLIQNYLLRILVQMEVEEKIFSYNLQLVPTIPQETNDCFIDLTDQSKEPNSSLRFIPKPAWHKKEIENPEDGVKL